MLQPISFPELGSTARVYIILFVIVECCVRLLYILDTQQIMATRYRTLSSHSSHGVDEHHRHTTGAEVAHNIVHDCGDNDLDFPGVDSHSPVYFSFWVTVAFTLNYILGSGFLTLPWGFGKTGFLLGVGVLLLFSFFAIKSTYFILEALERANILNKAHLTHVLDDDTDIELTVSPGRKQLAKDNHTLSQSHSQSNKHKQHGSKPDVHSYQSIDTLMETSRRATIDPSVNMKIHDGAEEYVDDHNALLFARKLEITELCNLFLGDWGRQAYSIILIVYIYGTLWAYTTVFANSFAAHLSLGDWSYQIYLVLFALIVVPFSLREFSEQVNVQVVLSIFRIVMVSLMVLTTLVAFFHGHVEFGEEPSDEMSHIDIWKVSPSGLHLLMPVAAYAYIFHHSIPSLAHNVRDKGSLTTLFRTALLISMVSYIGVGAVVSMYFGDGTKSSSNLNWLHYLAFIGNNGGQPSLFAKILKFFVVLFPAIDVASAYPLNAYTLGNNIMCAYYGKDTHKHDNSRWQLNLFRLLAAIPPLLGASVFSDLGKITDFTGLTAFILAFVFPPLLSFFSARKLVELSIDPTTIHSSVWTSFPFQVLLFCCGVLLLIYVSGCLILL
jgi:amino acid permease